MVGLRVVSQSVMSINPAQISRERRERPRPNDPSPAMRRYAIVLPSTGSPSCTLLPMAPASRMPNFKSESGSKRSGLRPVNQREFECREDDEPEIRPVQ